MAKKVRKPNKIRKVCMVKEIVDGVVNISDPIDMFGETLRELYRFNKLDATVPALRQAGMEFVRRAYDEIKNGLENKWKHTSEMISTHLGGGAFSDNMKDTTRLSRIEANYFFLSCAMLNLLNKKDVTYNFLRQSLSNKNLANPNFVGSHYTGDSGGNINFVLGFLAAGSDGRIYAKKVVPALRKLKKDRLRMRFINQSGLEEDIERLSEYANTGKMDDREEYLIRNTRHVIAPLLKKAYGSGDLLEPYTYDSKKVQCTEKGDYVIRKYRFNPRYVVPLAKMLAEDSKLNAHVKDDRSRLFSTSLVR